MAHLGSTTKIRLLVIGSEVQSLGGEDNASAAAATILGPCRVIPLEFSIFSTSHIDVIAPREERDWAELVMALSHECLSAAGGEPTIAFRSGRRWVQEFESFPLSVAPACPSLLRKEAVYLITGGTGAIGLIVASLLAETGVRGLVLLSRSPLPKRDQWERLITETGADAELSRKLQAIVAIEKLGTKVLHVAADIARESDVREALLMAQERLGPIRGVFHAAGINKGALVARVDVQEAAEVIEAKLHGTKVLLSIFENQPLDFLLLFSSRSAFGAVGQAGYCAANAVLDAYAQASRAASRVISVNWDLWRDGGMGRNAVVSEKWKRLKEETLQLGILPEEGKECLRRVLHHPVKQIVVSPFQVRAWPKFKVDDESKGSSALAANGSHAVHARPALSSPFQACDNDLEKTVAVFWQNLFALDRVGRNDDFFELGGDSLQAVQFLSQLNSAFGLKIPLSAVFESSTPSGFAQRVLSESSDSSRAFKVARTIIKVAELSSEERQKLLKEKTNSLVSS